MASGTIALTRTGSGYLTGQIVWSSTSNGSEANSSKVTATLQIQRSALNSTTGTFTGTITVGGTSETISWYGTLPTYEWVTIKTITTTVNHNASGVGSCYLYAKINGPTGTTMEGTYVSGSETVTLDTIPRQAVMTSAANFNDEENPRITYSNPLGGAAPSLQAGISLTGNNADVLAYHDVDKTAGTDTVDLTESERNTIRAAVTGGNTRTVWIYLRTRIGETYYYSPQSVIVTIKNPNPTISPTIVDSNSKTIALTGNSSKLVRYYSNATIAMGAAAVKGATLASKKVTCGNKSLTADGTINAVESGSFVFTATDNRGNYSTKTVNAAFVEYVKLTCTLANNMPGTDGSMTVKVTGNYYNGSFGTKSNSLTVYYRYKIYGGSYPDNWTAMTVTKSGNTYSATANLTGFDYQTSYVFQAYAVDALATVYSVEKTVKATPVFDWSENDFRFNVPILPEAITISAVGTTDTQLQSVYASMGNATKKTIVLKQSVQDSLPVGGTWFVDIYKTSDQYGAISAIRYNSASTPYTIECKRSIYAGTWSDWDKWTTTQFAPAGYGLGEESCRRIISVEEITKNGYYYMWLDTANGDPTIGNYTFSARVDNNYNNVHLEGKVAGGYIHRDKWDGVWQPWEWVNPPMAVGVEYRTTERHQGKVVYTKLVNLNALPNATTKTVTHGAAATSVIRVAGVTSTGTTIPYRSGDSIGTIAANKTQIVVYYSYNASSATAHAQIWYTKD